MDGLLVIAKLLGLAVVLVTLAWAALHAMRTIIAEDPMDAPGE